MLRHNAIIWTEFFLPLSEYSGVVCKSGGGVFADFEEGFSGRLLNSWSYRNQSPCDLVIKVFLKNWRLVSWTQCKHPLFPSSQKLLMPGRAHPHTITTTYIRDKRMSLVHRHDSWWMWQKIRSGTESKALEIICLFCLVGSAFKKYIVCFVLVLSVIEWRKKAGSVNFGGSSGSRCVTGQWVSV